MGRRGTRRWITSAWAALLVFLLMPATGAAAPAWQPAQLVSPTPAYDHRIALSPTGHALAVWQTGDIEFPTTVYAWRTPHGGWGPPAALPGGGVGDPAIGLSSFGDATVAYGLPGGGVGIATARAGQTLKQTDSVDGPAPILPHYSPDVALAVDDEGGATVAWVTTPVALVATRQAGGRFGAAQELGNIAAFSIALAVNPAGAAVVAWGIGSQSVRARYRLAGETRFGREEKIPRASDMGGPPLARIKDDGTAIVASSIRGPFGFSGGVSYSERPPIGRFGPEARLEGNATLSELVAEPQSASSFIANTLGSGPDTGAITLTTRSSAGSFAAPTVLSPTDSCEAAAGSNPLGQLVVAWTRPCTYGSASVGAIRARRRDGASAAFDATSTLTSRGQYPRVAVSPTGEAIVTWKEGSLPDTLLASAAFEDPAAKVLTLLRPRIAGGRRPAVTLPAGARSVGLVITCSRACTVLPDGIITTDGKARAKAMKSGKRRLSKQRRTRVRVRFSKARLRQARAALRRGDRATVSYTVTVRRRGSIRGASFSRSVRLKLPR